jgi:hypothetical protein
LSSAAVALSVPVTIPLASVVAAGCVKVLPLPVDARITVAPWIGLPNGSRAVTVIVALLAPVLAVIDPEAAVTVDWAALTSAGVTVTIAVCVTPVPSIVAETTLSPAAVALSVPVTTPLALVGPRGCVSVVPEPVAARITVAPAIGLPNGSRAVTVTVALLAPADAEIVVGAVTTVDCPACTPPGVTVTVAVCVTPVPLIVAETTLSAAAVALSVPVAIPLASVVSGCVTVLPLPVAARITVAP